jgi:hypothetical protein
MLTSVPSVYRLCSAIALSLKDAEKPTGKVQSQISSLYPAVLSGSSAQQQKNREPRKVFASILFFTMLKLCCITV